MKLFGATLAIVLMFGMSAPDVLAGALPVQGKAANQATTNNSKTIKYFPHMTTQSLTGRLDSDIIEFPNGRKLSVGQLRGWETFAARLHGPRVDRTPLAFKIKPNANNIRMSVSNASELAAALKLTDSETVKLPSGKLATVAQIKLVQPFVEKKLGRKLTQVPIRTALSSTSIRVSKSTPTSEWKNIAKMSDTTILETPNGARITIADLKQEAKKYVKSRSTQVKTAPQQDQKGRVK